ncbi:MAG: leucine-rich repeat domain-containing protein [Clostridia bacterium]|nr:leucine-rich repeat domain-containing protein [Clostridia bacterium]
MKTRSFKKLIVTVLLMCVVVSTVLVTAYAVSNTTKATDVKMEIVANNVSYSDSLYILYAISHEGFDRAEHEIKMLFWDEARDSYALGTEDYSVSNSGKTKVKGKECLVFYTHGIAAKEMTDSIYARACVVIDGAEYYTDVMKFSVLEYVYAAKQQGNIGNGQLKLFTSMLEYGTAAQNSFGHNTNRPANGTYYKISVVNGKLPDGFTEGLYLANQKPVLTANEPAQGLRFSHWIDENGIIVSFDREFEITVGGKAKTYTAIYKDVSNVVAQLMLKAEIPYNGDLEDVDLPTAVTFEVGGNTVTLDVTWDTSHFALSTIGLQRIYGQLVDLTAYTTYGIEPGSIVLEVTTLPYAYELDPNNGEYVITGYYGTDERITLPSTYRNTYITRIATRAFNSVITLREVVIPDTIQKIDNGAFFYCDNIEKMTVPFVGESATSSNSWFGWIFGATQYDAQHGMLPLRLKAVTLADGATKVPNYAFYKCTQIETFNIPNEVTELGIYAFGYCTQLTEFTLPNNLKRFNSSFADTNITKIYTNNIDLLYSLSGNTSGAWDSPFGYGADLYCNGKLVTELIIPSGVTNPGRFLKHCTSIKKIVIPASVTEFSQNAFTGMTALEEVIFEDPSSITDVFGLFGGCTSLKSVDLSGFTNLKTLGGGIFSGCISLTDVKLPTGLTALGNSAFSQTAIREISLPEGIQKIPYDCFCECTQLESITIPNGVVEIGERAFYGCSSLRRVTMPAALVSIGRDAFRDCTKLSVIDLPERLYDIGSYAFYGCSNLAKLIIRSDRLTSIGGSAFSYCTKLVEVYNLSSLTFTAGSTDHGSVAQYAKVVHTSLEEATRVAVDANGFIIYTDEVENLILGYAGNETEIVITAPGNGKPTRIAERAFYDNDNLTKVTIPAGITEIGTNAFYSCPNLTSVTIGSSVESIGEQAFGYCSKLVEVINRSSLQIEKGSYSNGYVAYYAIEVHNGESKLSKVGDYLFYTYNGVYYLVAYIGNDTAITLPESYNGKSYVINQYAFFDCDNLTSVTIGNGVKNVGAYAFKHCSKLQSIIINSKEVVFAQTAFEDCNAALFTEDDYGTYVGTVDNPYAILISVKSQNLTTYVIHEGTQFIARGVFRYCDNMTSVTIPDSVTTIGNDAFKSCSNLTSVTIGNGVTTIGECAFSGCTSLTSVTIGSGVEIIGEQAFYSCIKLTSIVIPDSVTTIGSYAFCYCSNLTSVTFENAEGWYVTQTAGATDGTNLTLDDTAQNAKYLRSTYYLYYWYRNDVTA